MGEKFNNIKNPSHKLFVAYYLQRGSITFRNATQSYLKSYPKAQYSTAKTKGSQLVAKGNISDAIKEGLQEFWDERDKDVGKLYTELDCMALSNIKDVVDYKDGVLTIKNFEDIDARAIQSIEVNTNKKILPNGIEEIKTRQKIKLYDKTKSMSDMLKVLNMTDLKSELTEDISVIIPAVRPSDDEDEPEPINKKKKANRESGYKIIPPVRPPDE